LIVQEEKKPHYLLSFVVVCISSQICKAMKMSIYESKKKLSTNVFTKFVSLNFAIEYVHMLGDPTMSNSQSKEEEKR